MMDSDKFDWIIGGLSWATLIGVVLLFLLGVIE